MIFKRGLLEAGESSGWEEGEKERVMRSEYYRSMLYICTINSHLKLLERKGEEA
jgi:hypothetical protein